MCRHHLRDRPAAGSVVLAGRHVARPQRGRRPGPLAAAPRARRADGDPARRDLGTPGRGADPGAKPARRPGGRPGLRSEPPAGRVARAPGRSRAPVRRGWVGRARRGAASGVAGGGSGRYVRHGPVSNVLDGFRAHPRGGRHRKAPPHGERRDRRRGFLRHAGHSDRGRARIHHGGPGRDATGGRGEPDDGETFQGGQSPLGRCFQEAAPPGAREGPCIEVVGVAATRGSNGCWTTTSPISTSGSTNSGAGFRRSRPSMSAPADRPRSSGPRSTRRSRGSTPISRSSGSSRCASWCGSRWFPGRWVC